jgi:Dynamin family
VTLHERVLAAFDRADDIVGEAPGLGPVRDVFAEERLRFLTTLRVVLVGRISSGKSTLANALLGSYRVATGPEELTYNVNWLRYAAQPRLEVHFRDGRPTEQRGLAELEQITVRARQDSWLHDYVQQIDFIEVFDPNPQLRDFDLVDTPGLDSHFAEDSANTLRFLGRGDDEVRQTTVAAAGKADALVLVFARGLASSEGELLADFNGAGFGAANPIAAIGALTKVETYWPAHQDPWAAARKVADQTMTSGGGRRLLYELRPVASLVAAAAATLTEPELADLTELAQVEPAVLAKFAGMGQAFSRERSDLPLPAGRRRALRARLSGYGIVLACGLLRDGVTGLAGLRAELIGQSGISDFRGLLVSHFGHRAELIKLQRVMAGLRGVPQQAGPRLTPLEQRRVDYAVAEVTQLEVKEHALRELAVLRRYYDGALNLDDAQSADLLRVSGEHGTSAAARLGLPADASAEQQADRARALLDRWAAFTADPAHGSATRQAGYVMRRSAERLLTQITAPDRPAARMTEGA